MATVITPNMNLSVPVVGQEPGPTWAIDINSCMSNIDTHDHSAGKGVLITPAGLNISTDLPYNNNNAISLRTVRFTPNPTIGASDLNAAFVNGVDLYYVDGNGNQVRITQSGAVAGTPGSIANLVSPASASYVSASSKFVWQAAANTAADTDMRNVILRNSTASSKGLTLQPPTAMGSDYSITLPALPGSTNIMTMDVSGNMGAVTNVDNSTLQIVSNVISVKKVTPAQFGPVGQQVSSSSGSFITASTSYVDVTNLTVTITTFGNPIMLFLQSSAISADGLQITPSTTQGIFGISFVRGSTRLSDVLAGGANSTSNQESLNYPPGQFLFLDVVAAGTYTYKVQGKVGSSGLQSLAVNGVSLVAYEV